MTKRPHVTASIFIVITMVLLRMPAIAWTQLPDPDGKSADSSKPVQVYILMGQSNMLGFGKIKGGDGSLEHAVKEKKLYSYLIDDEGEWTVRKDVRNVRVMGSGTGGMSSFNNEWMTITGGKIGPEIRQLRKDFDAPNAKFVCATLGQTKKGATDNGGKILDAMFAVDGKSGKYPKLQGNVATVYSHPLSKGGSSGSHYGGNAESYMYVGEAMGKAMVDLLKTDGK